MNTVNVNAESLSDQKLKQLRNKMADLGIKLMDFSRRDTLGNVDMLELVQQELSCHGNDIQTTIAQLLVLDEITRPVGSRGNNDNVQIRPSVPMRAFIENQH